MDGLDVKRMGGRLKSTHDSPLTIHGTGIYTVYNILYIWGLSNKALLFELVSPAFRDPFAFAEKPQVFLSRIVMSLFHCTEFTVFGTSKSLLVR